LYRAYEKYRAKTGLKRIPEILLYLIKLLIAVFIAYMIITSLFINSYRVGSISMKPTLNDGDRVLVTPLIYGPMIPFTNTRINIGSKPRHGDIVVLEPPYIKILRFPLTVLEPVVGFFSLHRGSLRIDAAGNRIYPYMIKRVVGVPGDTVKMENFIVYIEQSGKSTYTRENELIRSNYRIVTDFKPSGWEKDLPFSGNIEPISLGRNEYFVLGDNRPESSDSRSWGIVKYSRILGKVIFRYWPPKRIGKL